jgi:two-component SAPR family response regulator
MPVYNGFELAERIRNIDRHILIVFISDTAEHIREINRIGADYFLIKPTDSNAIHKMMERMRLLVVRQHKDLFIQTFGNFMVTRKGVPIKLTGKAKEILAVVVSRRGKEISNESIYSLVWENREYSNQHMTVYFNALKRLKEALKKEGLQGLLISTGRGQMVDTSLFDCDYYDLMAGKASERSRFFGEFMAEYSWGEMFIPDILDRLESNLKRSHE